LFYPIRPKYDVKLLIKHVYFLHPMEKQSSTTKKLTKASKRRATQKDPTLKLHKKGARRSSFALWQKSQLENL